MNDESIVPGRLSLVRQVINDASVTIKGEHRYRFAHITEVLYEYDPVGLTAFGAPSDEYDPEAATILVRYVQADFLCTVAELAEIVREEFVHWFGKECFTTETNVFTRIAEEIITNEMYNPEVK